MSRPGGNPYAQNQFRPPAGGFPPADPRLAVRPEVVQPPPPQQFQPAQIIARVGDLPILAGELLGPINQALEPYLGRVTDEQLAVSRMQLMQRMLPMVIETKMVFLDFRREIPSERFGDVERQVYDQYDEKQLPIVMQKAGVSTPNELDARLRSYGSSLSKAKRAFFEQVVGQQMVQRSLDLNPKITHEEMREYYEQNVEEYRTVAQVRWEQLMVRYDRFNNSQPAAEAYLSDMGNEVLRGAPFAVVARQKSHGFTADQGGYHDWTAQGSLVSKALDEQLFTLPVARLSPIIADDQGVHILRVIERRNAAQVPFRVPPTVRIVDRRVAPNPRTSNATLAQLRIENSGAEDVAVEATVYVRGEPQASKKIVVPAYGASEGQFELNEINPANFKPDDFQLDIDTQTRIQSAIRTQKIEQQREAYLAGLRERTPVWTIFGDLAELEAAAAAAGPR